MNDGLYNINLSYSKERLQAEFSDTSTFEYFFAPHKPEQKFDYKWLIKRVDGGYGQELSDKFSSLLDVTDIRPRFMIQRSGYSLGFHKDAGTACSINFVCNNDPGPINFRDGPEYYEVALLNTQVDHAVLETKEDRWLFKLSIFDKTYDEVKSILMKHGKI